MIPHNCSIRLYRKLKMFQKPKVTQLTNKPYKDFKERTRPMCKNLNTARAFNLFDVLAICVYGSNHRRWNNIPNEYPAADGWGDTSDEKSEAYKKCKLRNNIQMAWRLARGYATCPALADNPDLPAFLAYLMRLIFICLLYTSPSPRDGLLSRMPSSA